MLRHRMLPAVLGAAAITVAVAAVVLGATAPAAAAPAVPVAPPAPAARSALTQAPVPGDVAPQTISRTSWVDVARTLYQCPGAHCNRGQAYPGQQLANACYFWDGSQYWDLVYNRANAHSGFIPESHLGSGSPRASLNCNTIGVGGGVVGDSRINLYQCPGAHCNRGYADPVHDLAILCYVHISGTELYWIWTFNHNNLHEGFALHRQLSWPGWPDPPYGAC